MSPVLKLSGIYALISGITMPFFWVVLLFTGQFPEMKTEPLYFSGLLAAETCTALGLLTAGIGLLKHKAWGLNVFFIFMGMLLYASLFAIGKFAQKGNIFLVVFFILIALSGGIILYLAFIHKDNPMPA